MGMEGMVMEDMAMEAMDMARDLLKRSLVMAMLPVIHTEVPRNFLAIDMEELLDMVDMGMVVMATEAMAMERDLLMLDITMEVLHHMSNKVVPTT